MSERVSGRMSAQKAKSLSVFVPVAAVLVLSAVLATPGLAAYACGDDSCKDKDKDKDKNKKITICHKDKDTITISKNAWEAHKDHGDYKGPCKDKKDY
jgi:hypothetical protein